MVRGEPWQLRLVAAHLLDLAPDFEASASVEGLARIAPRSLVLAGLDESGARWLNVHRNAITARDLRVVLWMPASFSLRAVAPDLESWTRVIVDLPPGPPEHAVRALASAPGARVRWEGSDLERTVAAAWPARKVRPIDIASSRLLDISPGQGEVLVVSGVAETLHLRHLLWALARRGSAGPVVLRDPKVPTPRFTEASASVLSWTEASSRHGGDREAALAGLAPGTGEDPLPPTAAELPPPGASDGAWWDWALAALGARPAGTPVVSDTEDLGLLEVDADGRVRGRAAIEGLTAVALRWWGVRQARERLLLARFWDEHGEEQASSALRGGLGRARRRVSAPRVHRYWTIRGGPVFVDEGYLEVPSDPEPYGLLETGTLLDGPVRVLLGEPGIGKSTEIRRLAGALAVRRPDDVVRLVDLASVGSHDHLREVLAEATELAGPVDLWLLVDSLDECLFRVSTAADVIVDAVRRVETARLFLRLVCRTGAWPVSLEARLEGTWGGERGERSPLEVLELLPLGRGDVRTWVQRRGRSEGAFLDAVDRAGLGALAARPITLRLLLDVFEGSRLPETRAELFAAGVERLAGEWSDRRREASPDPAQVRRRMAAAGRIATVLLLSARRSVSLAPGTAQAGSVALADLRGLEGNGAGRWPMDEQVLDDVVRGSALFSALGPHERGFDHHTFAEYLAARHLVDHGFTGSAGLRLLAPEGTVQVAPQLEGLAAWLAALDPEARDGLAENQPKILLRTDPAVLDDTARSALVERILSSRSAGATAVDFETDDFRNLAHPALEAQLRQALEPRPDLPPAQALALRRTAVRMAGHTQQHELIPRLLALALGPDEERLLRVTAAHAARTLDREFGHTEDWLRLAHGEAGPDPDHDLRGIALQALWPVRRDLVDLEQVLGVAARSNYFGPLYLFANFTVPEQLDVGDVPGLLRLHVRTAAPGSWMSDRLWLAVYEVAWPAIPDSPEALEALVDSAYQLRERHQGLPVVPGPSELRHLLIEALLEDPRCEEDTLWRMGLGFPNLLHRSAEDLEWAIEKLRAASSERERANYRDAVRLSADFDDPRHVELLKAACGELPLLRDAWAGLFADAAELDSPEAARKRRLPELAHPPPPPLIDPPPADRIADRLRRSRTDPTWFPQLLAELTLEPRSMRYGSPFAGDLRELPGWREASDETRAGIRDCAARYLATQDPEPASWFGSNKLPRRALAGMQAALLLQAEEPGALASGADLWPRWAATFHELSSLFHSERSSALVLRAATEAPAAVGAGARLRLRQAGDDSDYTIALQRLAPIWNADIAALVRAEVDRIELGGDRRASALWCWLGHEGGDPKELAALESDAALPLPVRVRAAVHHFHHHGRHLPPTWWRDLQADEPLAEAVSLALNDWRLTLEGTSVEQPAAVLVDLYRWLGEQRDPTAGAWMDSETLVATSPIDWREELRTRLPGWLANRGGLSDVRALEELAEEDPLLLRALGRARVRWLQQAWKPMEPQEVVERLANGPVSVAPAPVDLP